MKVIDHKQYQTEKATKKFLHDNNMFMKAKTNKIYIGALLLALVGFAWYLWYSAIKWSPKPEHCTEYNMERYDVEWMGDSCTMAKQPNKDAWNELDAIKVQKQQQITQLNQDLMQIAKQQADLHEQNKQYDEVMKKKAQQVNSKYAHLGFQ